MKIILFVFAIVLCSVSIKAQKTILNERVNIQLRPGMEKIQGTSLTALAKRNNIKLVQLPNSENRSTYFTNDVIVTIFASKKEERVDLDKLKKGMDEWGKLSPGYIAKIVQIGEKRFLITQNDSESKIRFYGTNLSGTSSVNGLLEFNESSRSKAQAALSSLLASIGFNK